MTTFFLNTLRYGKTFALTLLIACVSACTSVVPSDYAQPSVQVPDAFKAARDGAAQTLIDEQWWLGFKDPYLNELVARSLQGNVDLAIAVARLDEAGASIDQVGAAMLPRLVLDTQVQRRGVNVPFSNQRQTSEEYSVNAQLGWEIDLWGKLRKGVRSRKAAYRASEADWRAAYLATIARVTSTYFLVRQLDEQLAIQQQAVASAKTILSIYRAQHREGVGANTRVLRQEAELNNLERARLDLQRERRLAENTLALLLGVPANDLDVPADKLSTAVRMPVIPSGLPAQLMSRRPDVVAAEYRVLEAHELVGEAQLAQLPSLSLTGNSSNGGNLASAALSSLVKSASFGIGPSFNIPIFDPSVRARVKTRKASAKRAEAEYRKTVLDAFLEVENTLVNVDSRQAQRRVLQQEQSNLRMVAKQVRAQLEAGLVSQLEVLESERRLLLASQSLLGNQREILSDIVTLYKALGGGWSEQSVGDVALRQVSK